MNAPLPCLHLTKDEFDALLEYSASLPTGTTPGKRWKRLDGAHDQSFKARGGKPRWMIGEYDPTDDGKGKTIRINWYRPVIHVRATSSAGQQPQSSGEDK